MNEEEFSLDPKKRFSSRVENYIKYRPKYPQGIIKYLKRNQILYDNSIVADIGSETGILSELFLKNGNLVYGIEPKTEMRNAGEDFLKKYSRFISKEGSAESTGLTELSIDIITAGQAFHWFNLKKSRKEFLRILKPNGWLILIWNRRKKKADEFLRNYEKLLLTFGTDYITIEKKKLDFDKFFRGELGITFTKVSIINYQIFNYQGLEGRLLSTSYIPLSEHPQFRDMVLELKGLFDKFQENGVVKFLYETEIFYGQLI